MSLLHYWWKKAYDLLWLYWLELRIYLSVLNFFCFILVQLGEFLWIKNHSLEIWTISRWVWKQSMHTACPFLCIIFISIKNYCYYYFLRWLHLLEITWLSNGKCSILQIEASEFKPQQGHRLLWWCRWYVQIEQFQLSVVKLKPYLLLLLLLL